MIAGFDGSSLTQGRSGVGYYTSRLLAGLAQRLRQTTSGARRALQPACHRPVGARCAPVRGTPPRSRRLDGGVRAARAAPAPAPTSPTSRTTPAPLRLDLPYLVTVHDMSLALLPWCSTWKMRLIVPRVLPRRGAAGTAGPDSLAATRDDVVRLLGIDPGRVRVIPHRGAPRLRSTGPRALLRGTALLPVRRQPGAAQEPGARAAGVRAHRAVPPRIAS